MRRLLGVIVMVSLVYVMTGLVYAEGGFGGALVVKPYPMITAMFGGGEEGAWARHHPGEPPPWFVRKDIPVIARFDWEQGEPAWVAAYMWGYLITLLEWVVFGVAAVAKLIRARRHQQTGAAEVRP